MMHPPRKILVVEDENIVAMDLRATLERLGYQITDTVGTGEEAVESAERRPPDLVLMDINLRGSMDGIQAGERMRQSNVPLVYLTAFSDEATLRRARVSEPFAYLLKPFDERELQIAIEMAIYRHRAQIEHEQLLQEKATRAAVEKAHRWSGFLADASRELSSSLDVASTLQTVARLAVSELADWCAIHARTRSGPGFELVAIHHAYGKEALVRELLERYPPSEHWPHAFPQVIRTGRSEVIAEFSDELLASLAVDEENLRLLRSLGLRSQMCVPLVVRGEVWGALTLASAETPRRYDEEDLARAVELTQRCALAVDNARLYQQAKEAIGIREEFLSIAAHELRTPLTAVLLVVHGFQRTAVKLGSEDLKTKAERALRQIGKLSELIDRLLDVSRIDARRLELNVEETDLVALVREVAERFAESAVAAGAALELKGPDKLVLNFDRLRIEQVITNLLSNAIKFGAGSPVTVVTAETPSGARLTIRDQGIGIAPEKLSRIFDRFERAVSARQYGGLGLGLYIARQIVEAHGGTVKAESQPGSGSVFVVELPRREARREVS